MKISLLFLLLGSFCFSQVKTNYTVIRKSDLQNLKYKGNIKSITSYKDKTKIKVINFNRDGNILDWKGYDLSTGKIQQMYSKTYDSIGREISYKDEFFIIIHKYDDTKGSEGEYKIHALKKDTMDVYLRLFDANKNILQLNHYGFDANNNKRYSGEATYYKYDSLNRLVLEDYQKYFFDKDGKPNTEKNYKAGKEYIYENNRIKKIATDNRGKQFITDNFTFPSGEPLYESEFDYYTSYNDGLNYDGVTGQTTITKFENKEHTLKKVLVYSKEKLCLSFKFYDKEKLIHIIEYKYDAQQNKIEEHDIDYKRNKNEVTRYIFTYY